MGRVVETFGRMAPEVFDAEVSYADGTMDTLTGTPNHPFWVPAVRDYVPLGKLEVGTVLHVQGGGGAILVSKTWRQGDFEVFNFEVEGLHNYYVHAPDSAASGVLVHNSIASKGADVIGSLASRATRNADSAEIVLGKFNEGGVSYLDVATTRGSSYLFLDDWDDVSRTMPGGDMWPVNAAFIQSGVDSGKTFIRSHNPATATGAFRPEVDRLVDPGFGFVQEGSVWRATR